MSVPKKDYKHTVHLPQTSFPMRANLPEEEPKWLGAWEKEGLYGRIRNQSGNRHGKYILHDGPPYANGNIHIGHALNKILKDIIVKYKTMQGFNALYVPGWDCHGLPIEHQCLKEMGKRKDEVERVTFRKQARKYAEKFIEIQREEFKRLGVFGQWNEPYRTMDYDYQASIAESFLTLYEEGFIEQHLKPVPWCYDCETALADAELEYEDKKDQSIYFKFLVDPKTFSRKFGAIPEYRNKPVFLLVWTTTPWTLPANVGAAVHPDLKYDLVGQPDEIWIVAENRVPQIMEIIKKDILDPKGGVVGKQLEDLEYSHPFVDRKGRVILADYVSSTDGTGVVHIAPGHGEEDYQYGHLKSGLAIVSPVDEKGRFTKEFSLCKGMNVFKANEKIIELLKEKKAFLYQEDYLHSYPHCWRCKKPIIFRATPQWFLKMDHQNLRDRMRESIQSEIKFTPDWGKNRIGSMVETRPDWCLSRQRYWGVPIPVVSCKSCRRVFVSESKKTIVELFRKNGADIWFATSASDFLGGMKPACCAKPDIQKETDIIDVWFDSGVSHQAVLKKNELLSYPANLYLEGSDQHRGWFQSALTTAMALDHRSPFMGVLTHGFVVDGEGKKMSKSAGNVVAPQDVMKEFGADILRLWVSSCDYQFDVRLSKEILKQLADSYRKIRNTFRYLLGNLCDFDPEKNCLAFEHLDLLDQWAIQKTDDLVNQKILPFYDQFKFHQIYREVYDFCVLDLSSYYFDILKDTLYTAGQNSRLRRSAQTALFHILKALVKVMAPILSFTADEVWRSFPIERKIASVHESVWFLDDSSEDWKGPRKQMNETIFGEWEHIREVRDAVNPFLERKRESKLIGSSLDAKIYLKVYYEDSERILKKHMGKLTRVFIVSQASWLDGTRENAEEGEYFFTKLASPGKIKIAVAIEKAEGTKCERCWNYSVQVGHFPEHPTICERCVEAISSPEINRP